MLPNNMIDSHMMCVQRIPQFNARSFTASLFYKQSLIIENFETQRFKKLVGFLVSDLLVLSGLEYFPIRHYEL
jgi:hypothetical protein